MADSEVTGPVKRARQKERLTPAARRALAEALERRKRLKKKQLQNEIDGPQGLEPTRYGDWERRGIASDF